MLRTFPRTLCVGGLLRSGLLQGRLRRRRSGIAGRARRGIGALALALAASLTGTGQAAACATCGAGDPTLMVMGAERPLAGRLRFSLQLEGRADTLEAPDREPVLVAEGLATLSMSYAPVDRVALMLSMPLSLRDVSFGAHSHYTTLGPGDAELRARVVLLQDRSYAPENLLGVTAGVRAPTSVDQVGPNGALLPTDAQNGAGAITPLLGAFFTHLEDPWSFFASATVALPVAVRFADAPGPSLALTAALQYRVDQVLTIRGGVDARLDAPSTIDGVTAPHTEHAIVFVSPALLLVPATDWIVQLGVRAPVAQVSAQGRVEGFTAYASVTVDAS